MAIYKFYETANRQQDQIWDYTFAQWGQAQAEKYIRGLHDHLQHLAGKKLPWHALPQALTTPPEIDIPVYFRRYQKHILFFRELSDGIGIMTILHQAMDVPVRLAEDLKKFEERGNR